MNPRRLPLALLLNAGLAVMLAACGQADPSAPGSGGSSSIGTGGTTGGTGVPAAGGTTGGGAGTTSAGGAGGSGAIGATGGTGATTGGTGATGATGGSGAAPAGGSAGLGGGGTGPAGSGGTGMAGGGATAGSGGAGGMTSASCTVTATATQSTAISTVFNVSFTTDLPGVDKAEIQFGLDTSYGYTAPVDMTDAATPLLGMKPSKEYHYRVVVSAGATVCNGPDQTLMTGPIANGLPKPMIVTNDAAALAGGFLIAEWYAGRQLAFILDKDSEIVWWFDPKIGDLTRARMSYDGKYMWIAHGNVPSGQAHMVRVKMDGTDAQDMSSSFTGLNHDFTILPDETLYFIAYGNGGQGGCDDIKKYDPASGMTTTVMNIGSAFSGGACHANAIEYSSEDDTLVVSELDHNAYVKLERTGEVVWVLGGGSDNDFTGDGSTWQVEHNLHMLGANHLLMFNNGTPGGNSKAIELELDPTAKTVNKLWEYAADPKIFNQVMGDVQRLPNGNTLVTYSTQGVIHEVDPDKKVLQTLSWGTGGAVGYVIKRPTLYGPSPK